MNKELENQLYAAAPEFYKERTLPMTQSLMCFGFECGDGWFIPLLEFSRKVNLLNRMAKKHGVCFIAAQVKEKFGEIRVYWTTEGVHKESLENEEAMLLYSLMEDACEALGKRCWNTCENCGATGDIITTGGWIQRLCQDCAGKEQRESGRVTNYMRGFSHLSPFQKEYIRHGTDMYNNVISLYFALLHPERAGLFRPLKGMDALHVARELGLCRDNQEGIAAMEEALRLKYQGEYQAGLLLSTGDLELCGMNNFHENFWGGCVCQNCKDIPHSNNYGKLLMKIRGELKEKEKEKSKEVENG